MRTLTVLIAVALLSLTACGVNAESNTESSGAAPATEVEQHSYTTLTTADFDAFIAEGRTVVDFWAAWCGPCRQIAPIYEELSNEIDTVKFGKLNVDDHGAVAQKYGIRSIPTMIVFENGEEVDRIVGGRGKEALRSFITGE